MCGGEETVAFQIAMLIAVPTKACVPHHAWEFVWGVWFSALGRDPDVGAPGAPRAVE